MKYQIKFLALLFCALFLFCCKENKSSETVENTIIKATPTDEQLISNSQSDTKEVYTITLEELFSKKDFYSKKSIIANGKVTKINNGIMNRNWVHISDGTQFEEEKSLTITTLDTVQIGDVVSFKGTITLNKDFGYGYVYKILLEEGEISEQKPAE